MSRNAVAAFRGLGFDDDDVAALGYATRAEGTWQANGRPILSIPDNPHTRQAVALIGVHRQRIHRMLCERARQRGVEILTGMRITNVSPGAPDGARALVAGRAADLVVAAGGMRSGLRHPPFPTARPSYRGYSSWRAITSRSPELTARRQLWGP